MCKVLKNFTEGKQRNLGLILAIFTRFSLFGKTLVLSGHVQSRTQSMPVRRLGAGHDSGETEYRISNFGYPVGCAHTHAQTATLNSRVRH
jgi:hypothetical protein